MAVRRAPLLLAAALFAVCASVPASADREPRRPDPVPAVTVRPPAPPKGVTVGPRVSVPKVRTWRSPVPRVSISVPPARRRAKPKVTLPHVTVYQDAVCTGRVVVGECPRKQPREAPRPAPRATPMRLQPAPAVVPVPLPSPDPTPTARSHVKRFASPGRRKNPMTSVLLTVVLVTAITSTTAVAFRSRR
ncbi:hypothetical protein [Nonomuraea rosea]|uniref:hypothetical protein n=1 Tax=Nonomuraea rosea TaxID=638574 RepID=UPI0031E84814